ncbi:hypothetical protein [Streptomyces prasinus]|uniref:hypothetical protein n=1 Tax=Streptomyces prasinus TaxID=67345 RepID=UPI0036968EA7
MAKAGKTVTILHCKRPVANDDLDQRIALRDYLRSIEQNALVMTYTDEAELVSRIDNLLSRQAALFMAKISSTRVQNSAEAPDVWPSVDFRERVDTDRNGRLRTRRSHYIVLTNKGRAPAKNVTFTIEPDDGMVVRGDDEAIDTVGPESEIRFPLALSLGSPSQFNCSVKWQDANGNGGENVATLRPV